MSTFETNLDELTHAVATQMRIFGFQLNEEQLCSLNDVLNGFLKEEASECKKIANTTPQNECCALSFTVEGATVNQTIQITNVSYDRESIVDGLNAGTLCTTTWFGDGIRTIDVTATGEVIAEVLSQEVDGCYTDFE